MKTPAENLIEHIKKEKKYYDNKVKRLLKNPKVNTDIVKASRLHFYMGHSIAYGNILAAITILADPRS